MKAEGKNERKEKIKNKRNPKIKRDKNKFEKRILNMAYAGLLAVIMGEVLRIWNSH